MRKERINLEDSMQDAVIKMSEGNPGALTVLVSILSSDSIDPDNGLGGLGVILNLDSLGIYGTDIYILHNDICEGDIVKTLAVLRAVQLGFFSGDLLKATSHAQDRSGKALVPVDKLYAKVKERLPNFNCKQ